MFPPPPRTFGIGQNGEPTPVVVDRNGHLWTYEGTVAQNPPVQRALTDPEPTADNAPEVDEPGTATVYSTTSDAEDFDEGEPSEDVTYILVADGAMPDWLVYELHPDDAVVEAVDAEYRAMVDARLVGATESLDLAPGERGIIGADDRNVVDH